MVNSYGLMGGASVASLWTVSSKVMAFIHSLLMILALRSAKELGSQLCCMDGLVLGRTRQYVIFKDNSVTLSLL